MATNYAATLDRKNNGVELHYWSVERQTWQTANAQCQVSTADRAAMSDEDREHLARLSLTTPEPSDEF